MLKQTFRWADVHAVDLMCWSYLFIVLAFVVYLTGGHEMDTEYEQAATLSNLSAVSSRRMLKGGAVDADGGGLDTDAFIAGDGTRLSIMWVLLACGVFLNMLYTATSICMPFEKLNVFLVSGGEMLKNDLVIFVIIFGLVTITFFVSMFFLYPRSGIAELPQVASFNTPYNAAKALLELSLTGSSTYINLDPDGWNLLGWAAGLDMAIFLFMYFCYTLVALVLLLNLLIAMLSNTYENVRKESTLRCRVSFAQCVLKLELVAESLGMPTQVGEHADDMYVYKFRSVAPNSDGGGTGGERDPFNEPYAEEGALERVEEKLDALIKALPTEGLGALLQPTKGGDGAASEDGGIAEWETCSSPTLGAVHSSMQAVQASAGKLLRSTTRDLPALTPPHSPPAAPS